MIELESIFNLVIVIIVYNTLYDVSLTDGIYGNNDDNGIVDESSKAPDDSANDDVDEEPKATNEWGTWAQEIYNRVEAYFKNEGVDANAYFLPHVNLKKILLKDLELFPLWGNIMNHKFDFGRSIGSSAPVESEFNKIKSNLLAKHKHTIRVDKFVHEHINYLKGKVRLIDAAINEKVDNLNIEVDNSDHSDNFVRKNLALGEVENWRGKGNSSKKHNINIQTCIACVNGDLPTGAHVCVHCNTPVHIFETCSLPVQDSDEGYGQKRLCMKCAKGVDIQNKPTNSTTKNSYRKPAKYMGQRQDDVKDSLQWEKNKNFPVIKNGNDPSLAAIKIDKKNISLRNTCAFDSILYLSLIAVTDFPFLISKIRSLNNQFFNMILTMHEQGLNSNTYILRGRVLAEILKINESKLHPDKYYIECCIHVGWMAQNLYKLCPSFCEISICSECQYYNKKSLTAIQIEDVDLRESNPDNFIEDFCTNANLSNCIKCAGIETVQHNLSDIGNIIIFQIFNVMEENISFKLSDFHKELRNPLSGEQKLYLIGLVGYGGIGGIPKRTRTSDQENIPSENLGHYTSFMYRRGNTGWMEVDDQKNNSVFRTQNYKVVPRLLMYINK